MKQGVNDIYKTYHESEETVYYIIAAYPKLVSKDYMCKHTASNMQKSLFQQ